MQVNRIGAQPSVNFSGVNIFKCRDVETLTHTVKALESRGKKLMPSCNIGHVVPTTVFTRDGIFGVMVVSGKDYKFFSDNKKGIRKILSGTTKYGEDGKCDGAAELKRAKDAVRRMIPRIEIKEWIAEELSKISDKEFISYFR